MTQWKGSWTRLVRRRPWLIRAAVMIVASAVLVSELAGARYVIGWWAGPQSIGVGTEGADALAVSPDGRTLYAANWDESGDSGGITVVDLATGRAGKRIDVGGPAVEFTMMPGGRALYALVEFGDGSDRLVRVGLAAIATREPPVTRPRSPSRTAARPASTRYDHTWLMTKSSPPGSGI
jgi:hypothetical protein